MTANPSGASLAPVPTHSPAGSRLKPVDPLKLLRQYRWLLIVTAVFGVGLGVLLWWACETWIPTYTSEAQLQVGDELQDAWQSAAETGSVQTSKMEMVEAFMENQVIALKSVDLLMEAVQHPRVKATGWWKSMDTMEERLEAMSDDLRPTRLPESTRIRVTFRGPNEKDPPVILDVVIELFMSRYKRTEDLKRGSVRAVFDRTLTDREGEIDSIRSRMEAFRQEHDIETLDAGQNEAAIEYGEVSTAVATKKLELEAIRTYYQTLLEAQEDGRIVPTPQLMSAINASEEVKILDNNLRSMRISRDIMRERYGTKHRNVEGLERQMRATELERQREVDVQLREQQSVTIESANKAIEATAKQLDGLLGRQREAHQRMQDLLDKLKEYEAMETNLENAEDRLTQVKATLDEERIIRQRPDVNRINVVLNATAAELTFPDIYVMTLGTTVLLVFSVGGIIFLREKLDQRIKSPADLKLIDSVELLGVIPDAYEDPSGPAEIEQVVQRDPTGLMAEAIRQVRTTLTSRMEQRGYKSLLLCGAQASSGVSTVASNLAMNMAYYGRKVVILDANFRRPTLHELFGGAIAPGLVEVLEGGSGLDEVLHHHDDPQMDVVAAGSAASAQPELLEGESFKSLLIELEKQYDFIIIDGPPTLVASDSLLMAKHVDAVALVVRAMNEKRGLVGRMLHGMQNQRADLMGVVLNGVRSSAGGYFRENYQEFYRYRQKLSA